MPKRTLETTKQDCQRGDGWKQDSDGIERVWMGLGSGNSDEDLDGTECTHFQGVPLRTVRMGSTKAAVFPEPVGAATRASRPAIRIGRLCICTGVGSLYFRLSIFLSNTPRMWLWLPGLHQPYNKTNLESKKNNQRKDKRVHTKHRVWARV